MVEFTATAVGPASGTLTVTNGAKGVTLGIPLTGLCSGVTFTPNPLEISEAVMTTSAPQQVTLTNTLSSAIGITSIVLNGSGASSFVQTNTCGTSVPAMGTCTISVTFSPTMVQSYSGSITVTDTQPDGAFQDTLLLSGTGEAQASISPSVLEITLYPGYGQNMAYAYLTNNLPTPLNNLSLSTTSGFAIEDTDCSKSLAPGATCRITVINTVINTVNNGQYCNSPGLVATDSANDSPQSIQVCVSYGIPPPPALVVP